MEDGGDQMTMRDRSHRKASSSAGRLADPSTSLKLIGPRLRSAGTTAFIVLCLSLNLWAFGNDQSGTSGAVFLKIAPGARPVGMGEAYTGVADDIHSVYWNPAGLAAVRRPELSAMHMQYFQDIQYEWAAFAMPTKSHGTWGISISNLHLDNIQRRAEDTDVATGDFGASDSAYGFHYGTRIGSRLALGGTAKLIRESLDSVTANAFGIDLGTLYDTGWKDVKLGASAQNMGTKVKFRSESDPLPLTFRIGASKPFLERRLLVASDVILSRDNAAALALGGEYTRPFANAMAGVIRAGFKTGSDVDGLSGVSAGGGLIFGRAGFDFAWVPFGDLGNAYRFSLHLKFGAEETDTPNLLKQSASAKVEQSALRDTSLEQLLSL